MESVWANRYGQPVDQYGRVMRYSVDYYGRPLDSQGRPMEFKLDRYRRPYLVTNSHYVNPIAQLWASPAGENRARAGTHVDHQRTSRTSQRPFDRLSYRRDHHQSSVSPYAATSGHQISQVDESPIDDKFSVDKILFFSKEGGKYGSIYFPNGRIRLVHPDGPAVETWSRSKYFSFDYKYLKNYRELKKGWRGQPVTSEVNANTAVKDFENHLPSSRKITTQYDINRESSRSNVLIQIMEINGRLVFHRSRGHLGKFVCRLDQSKLNILYRAALTKNNRELVRAIKNDPELIFKIPVQR